LGLFFDGRFRQRACDRGKGSRLQHRNSSPCVCPPPYAGPFAEVGWQTFDGKGKTDGAATLSANGNIMKVTIEGTYSVNRDCTGSMTFYVPALATTVHANFVIDNDGTEIRAIVTDANVIEIRVYKKQFREDRKEQ
jgi:hypothetical protein